MIYFMITNRASPLPSSHILTPINIYLLLLTVLKIVLLILSTCNLHLLHHTFFRVWYESGKFFSENCEVSDLNRKYI